MDKVMHWRVALTRSPPRMSASPTARTGLHAMVMRQVSTVCVVLTTAVRMGARCADSLNVTPGAGRCMGGLTVEQLALQAGVVALGVACAYVVKQINVPTTVGFDLSGTGNI